jgi:hypothetical protein
MNPSRLRTANFEIPAELVGIGKYGKTNPSFFEKQSNVHRLGIALIAIAVALTVTVCALCIDAKIMHSLAYGESFLPLVVSLGTVGVLTLATGVILLHCSQTKPFWGDPAYDQEKKRQVQRDLETVGYDITSRNMQLVGTLFPSAELRTLMKGLADNAVLEGRFLEFFDKNSILFVKKFRDIGETILNRDDYKETFRQEMNSRTDIPNRDGIIIKAKKLGL